MKNVPQQLDWVDKRAACTIAAVFNQLCDGILADVEAFNLAAKIDTFQANLLSSGTTMVVGNPTRIPRVVVRVGIVDNRIEVQSDLEKSFWRVNIGLNDEGRCILRLEGGSEMEQWQFRKKALEGLFFGD